MFIQKTVFGHINFGALNMFELELTELTAVLTEHL